MRYINGHLALSGKKFDRKNVIRNGKTYYKIEYLSEEAKKSKGGNSSVFKLIDPNTLEEFAIKFLKYPSNSPKAFDIKQNIRFGNEITALEEAKRRKFENVIEIKFHGIKRVGDFEFQYYVMEKAENDLSGFLKSSKLAENQKIVLCNEITKGILELHSMDLYHRDIKPDNVFVVEKNGKIIWKVGDLGLSARRSQNLSQVEYREKIGPYGWLSPEVTNKVLCEGSQLEKVFDCKIDDRSDIFQLGKLFWFVFQGNIPVGQILYSDFLPKNKAVFRLVKNMLQYKKSRRSMLTTYVDKFQLLVS